MKKIAFIHEPDSSGAVGDFSPVTSVFSHYQLGNTISPFLLLDHLGPGQLQPTRLRKGVAEHPHRGFETVTIVYKGEIEHRDSTGEGGVIRQGDVQWMTAASGILHEEVFSQTFSEVGGSYEFLQLWVNLPTRDKMNPARYQSLSNDSIPVVKSQNSSIRVIAGEYSNIQGPALTHTPMNVFDLDLKTGDSMILPAKDGDTTLLYVLRGRIEIADSDDLVGSQHMAVMTNQGQDVELRVIQDTQLLYLSGQPLNEPLYARGYFVMNQFSEVMQAYEDLKNGTFIQDKSSQ